MACDPTEIVHPPEDDSYWLWTIQMAQHRIAKAMNIAFFDITVKSGIQAFSPTWDMLRAYRAGTMTEQEYSRQYILKVERTFDENADLWSNFLKEKNIAIACYCTPGVFCHRLLFTDILSRWLCKEGKEVVIKGEIVSKDQKGDRQVKKELTPEEVDESTNIPH